MKRPEDVINAWIATHYQDPRLRALATYISKEYRYYAVKEGWTSAPRTIGAASIYLACKLEGLGFSQREIVGNIPGPGLYETVSAVGLRHTLRRMEKGIPDLISRMERFRESLPKT